MVATVIISLMGKTVIMTKNRMIIMKYTKAFLMNLIHLLIFITISERISLQFRVLMEAEP